MNNMGNQDVAALISRCGSSRKLCYRVASWCCLLSQKTRLRMSSLGARHLSIDLRQYQHRIAFGSCLKLQGRMKESLRRTTGSTSALWLSCVWRPLLFLDPKIRKAGIEPTYRKRP